MNALAVGICHDFSGKEARVNFSLGILEYDDALAKRGGIALLVFADYHSGILLVNETKAATRGSLKI
jgi:hypothetical protein